MLRTLVAATVLLGAWAGRPKTNKDWGKMNDKDWDKVFEEWEDEDEKEEYAFKPPKQQGGGIDMEKLQKFKGNPTARSCPAGHPIALPTSRGPSLGVRRRCRSSSPSRR